MEEYKSNSHKSKNSWEVKEESKSGNEKKIEKVVTGTVRTKKRNGFSKFIGSFIPDDIDTAKSTFLSDILYPAIKRALLDGLDVLLNGSSGRSRGGSNTPKVSYRSYYNKRERPVWSERGYSYEEIIFNTRDEAEEVLNCMDDITTEYDFVSVADLYDLVGIQGTHTDNKYGWSNIRKAYVSRTADGYILKLPRPSPIDLD